MTKREFFNTVIATVENEEIKAFAQAEVAKLDAYNASRKSKPSKKSLENEPLIAKIAEVLTDEPKLASEIAEKVGLSTPKVSALAPKIDGVKVTEVKVKGKGVRKAYSIG